jgi:hypothetical protein
VARLSLMIYALIHDLMQGTGIYSNDDTTVRHHVVRYSSMKLPSGTPMVMTQPYTAYETCVDGGAMGVGSISKVSDVCE